MRHSPIVYRQDTWNRLELSQTIMNMVSSAHRNLMGLGTVSHHLFHLRLVSQCATVAGRTILPSIFEGIEDIANSSTGIKFVYTAISYKPFLSLFNMTGVAETYPQLASIGE